MTNSSDTDQRYVSIDLTKKCTNNCIFCVVEGRTKIAKDQEINDIEKFLTEYRKQGFTSVNLHGGEPTIFKQFDGLISLINELGYDDITVQTNGVKLDDSQFVDYLIKNNVKLFVVSMHDCVSKYHNEVTCSPNSFELASNGIKTILKQGGNVRTNTVLLKSNHERIGDIVDYIYGLGVRILNISSLNPYWITSVNNKELFDELTPTYKQLEPSLEKMLFRYSEKDVKITLEGFPYCFLPEYDRFNLYNVKREIIMLSDFEKSIFNYEQFLNEQKVRIKNKRCAICDRNDICRGVWHGYVKSMGWDEFQPIINN